MWAIPHPDAAGTMYGASDDYRWFRLIVGFERAACSNIDNGDELCGKIRLTITGDGQFSQILGENTISPTDETVLQSIPSSGSNKIILSADTIASSALYRGARQSDASYRYAAIFADVRACWRIGQALSKLTLKAEALVDGSFQDIFGNWISCTACVDVYIAWQTDWISADLATVTPVGDGNIVRSRGTTWAELFSFDMDPDGAAV